MRTQVHFDSAVERMFRSTVSTGLITWLSQIKLGNSLAALALSRNLAGGWRHIPRDAQGWKIRTLAYSADAGTSGCGCLSRNRPRSKGLADGAATLNGVVA